ncbi:uncharacterized protein [Branchiostoma lanceolatum]|uniref:uncharacterized protein n=1 Tax=Branchiostoma lanceolatum TaxID=7740 RepID=UPI003454A66B
MSRGGPYRPRSTVKVNVSLQSSDAAAAHYHLERYLLRSADISRNPPPRVVSTPAAQYEDAVVNLEFTLEPRHGGGTTPEMFFADLRRRWCADPPNWDGDNRPWLTTSQRNTWSEEGIRAVAHEGLECAGFSLGAFVGRSTFVGHYDTDDLVLDKTVSFEHDRRLMTVSFQPYIDMPTCRFEMGYKELEKTLLVHQDGDVTNLFFFLKYPLKVCEEDSTVEISLLGTAPERIIRKISFRGCSESVLGNSSCLKIVLTSRENPQDVLSRLCVRTGFTAHYVSVTTLPAADTAGKEADLLTGVSFKTAYAFRALLSRGFTARDQVTDAFIRQVRRLDRGRGEEVAADVLYRLTHVLERDRFANIQTVLDCLLAARDVELGRPETLPPTLQVVARVIVTPTRLVFLQPEIMYGNRVLREFGTDHFIRVVFRDEDFSKLQATGACAHGEKEEEAFARVREVLREGIKVGNRLYEFLAASNSQLREHGLWFFADDGRNNPDSIRAWMGDFSNSRCPATYLARMGQCFSTTESSVRVRPGQVSRIPDIEGGRDPDGKPYCFSDGIGKISPDLAREMCEKTQRSHEPSAFQVRYAGVKGMLAVDPALPGLALQYRKSMEKFSSDHDNIEICSESHPARLYLNRQIISILSALGIPDEVFRYLQDAQLRELGSMFLMENRAVDALNQRAQLQGVPYGKLSNCGIYMTREPFFKAMLRKVYKSGIGDIRRKARIAVPPEYGRNMLGVLDETGTLEYGQVFVQYTEDITDKGGETIVLTGEVVVARNPCFHPGDVRKLSAVDVPGLHHMVDVIVFPSKGERPHPNEMSGGDLDGDQFFVTWYPGLVFQRQNADPMHFKAPKKIELDIVTISDLQDFIVKYIKSDILGVIANAHLAFSDREEDGVFSQVCLSLAEKHSDAVDFPKTGVSPVLSDEERPTTYPDFMDKSHKKAVRRSKKVMGEMYRECQSIENICSSPERTDEAETIKPDPYLILSTHQPYKRQAEQSRDLYNDQLNYLMDRYGIGTEAEAMSGCIGRIHKHMDNRYDRHEVERIFKERIKDLRRRTRDEFFVEFGGEKNVKRKDYPPEVQAKASAWYVVTYSGINVNTEKRLLSFPWVVGDILAVIKITVAPNYPVSLHPSADHITTELETIYSSESLETVRQLSAAFKRQSVQHQVVQAFALRHPDTVALIAFLLQWAKQCNLLGRDIRKKQISQKSFLFLLATYAMKKSRKQKVSFIPDLELADYTVEWSELANDLLRHSRKRPNKSCINGGLGLLCVRFFRYLGSHAFVSARGTAHIVAGTALMLSKGCAENVQRQALRAYHLLSQTGDIAALIDTNITQRKEDWSAIIPPHLWKNYVSKRIKQVEEDLARISGAEVKIRPIPRGRRPRGRVSGYGSHDAILRLKSEVDRLIRSRNGIERAIWGAFRGVELGDDFLEFALGMLNFGGI